jgi:hypothetical protein
MYGIYLLYKFSPKFGFYLASPRLSSKRLILKFLRKPTFPMGIKKILEKIKEYNEG